MLDTTKVHTNLFINGKYVKALSGKHLPVYNPATNELLAEVECGGASDIHRAVEAAYKAFQQGPWPRMTVRERTARLEKMAELIEGRANFLGLLECLNVGKLLKDCREHDISRGAENFSFFAEEMRRLTYSEKKIHRFHEGLFDECWVDEVFYKDAVFLDKKSIAVSATIREPAGVSGLIVPWNSPFMLGCWKLGPCLAAGNTCVLKPAEWAPLTLLQLGEIAEEAGIPDGVINIVPGTGVEAGRTLAQHPLLKRLSFTGNTEVGKEIFASASRTFLRISFELGGKAPNIVFDDVDLEDAVRGAARASFRSQGQSCVAGSRLILHEKIYDEFIKLLVEKAEGMRIGNPVDPQTELGPLITREHLQRVQNYIQTGIQEGAHLLTGGPQKLSGNDLDNGNYLAPTIFDGVLSGMKVVDEEIFGPVLVVFPFRTEEEAIQIANSTHYGLSANVWTGDRKRALRLALKLESGMVWINSHFVRDLRAPFGGVKLSGYGREGGKYSLEFYTEPKMICTPLGS